MSAVALISSSLCLMILAKVTFHPKTFNMEQVPPPPPASSQTNCQLCTKPMDSSAVRCPSCGKLRKDIYNDKIKCYCACLLGGLLIGIGISKMGHRRNDLYDYLNQGGGSSNSTGTILLVIGIAAALVGIYFWYRVSQQLKTYWWS